MNRSPLAIATSLALLFALGGQVVQADFFADFDGGNTSAFNFTNSGGAAPSIMNGGLTGDFARLANLNGGNNNSIAFDEDPGQTGPAPAGLVIAFDFRMSDDAANAAAGGCCDSAADGLGLGLFTTSTYGASGGTNPADGGPAWERPSFADALTVGLDIFQNIDVVTLNWVGIELAAADVQPFMDLNDNTYHRVVLTVTPNGGDAVADLIILEDVHGATVVRNVMSGVVIPGGDPGALPAYRVIAGGRTGGAFVAGDIDNISVTTIPEPSTVLLLGLGGLATVLLGRRRR